MEAQGAHPGRHQGPRTGRPWTHRGPDRRTGPPRPAGRGRRVAATGSPACCLEGFPSPRPADTGSGGLQTSQQIGLLAKNAAFEVIEYLCRRPQNLAVLTGRVFAAARTGKYLTHTGPHDVLLSESVAVLVPKKLQAPPVGPCHREALCISGHFPGGASSRRRGFRTVRIPVYCPKEI